MTLFVRDLVDPAGDPFTLAGSGTSLEVSASVSTVAAVAAAAVSAAIVGASRSTTVSIAAAATTASPTDLSSSLVAGSGTYGPGTLLIPGWDQSYTVTASDARFSSGGATPGVAVSFSTPSTTGVAHSVTVTYTVQNTSRRFYHNLFGSVVFTVVDGLVVEPGATIGNTTSITYSWDPASQSVSVSSYSGSASVRDHGPGNAATYGLPLYFSPEARAEGTFATFSASHARALSGIPAATRTLLGGVGAAADVVQNVATAADPLFTAISWRGIFDPTADSGMSGLTTGRWGAAQRSTVVAPADGIEGRTMLHELGHVMDFNFLPASGHPQGIDPWAPADYTRYFYYPDGTTVEYRQDFFWTLTVEGYRERHYSMAGAVLSDDTFTTPRGLSGHISEERTIVELFTPIEIPGGFGTDYYLSTIREFVAQMCFLYWCQFTPGFLATSTRDVLIAQTGGSTVYANFVSYMQGIGAFP